METIFFGGEAWQRYAVTAWLWSWRARCWPAAAAVATITRAGIWPPRRPSWETYRQQLEAVQTEQEEQEDTEALETRIAKLTAAITALAAAQAADDVEAEEETTPTPATPAATPTPVPTPTPAPRPSTPNAEASQRALHLRDAFGATPTPGALRRCVLIRRLRLPCQRKAAACA